jgi:hypothetical protein
VGSSATAVPDSGLAAESFRRQQPLAPRRNADATTGLPPAILRRWLRRRIAALGDDPRTSPAAIDTVLRLAATGATGAVDVRGGIVWIRRTADGHRLAVEPVRGQSPQTP